MRGVLARKGVSYADLAAKLKAEDSSETARSVEGKIQRGALKCSFFLHTLHVVGAEFPLQWRALVGARGTWEQKASRLLQAEMSIRAGASIAELSRRLHTIGVDIPAPSLHEQIVLGAYPLTLLLQCAAVMSIADFDRFVDQADLLAAAAAKTSVAR